LSVQSRAQGIDESTGMDSICPGASRSIAIGSQPAGFMDLRGAVTRLIVGDQVALCFNERSVAVQSPDPVRFECQTIIDSPAEGLGYYFAEAGVGHHLWFYINPERSPHVLEIGLYRQDVELLWIDTGVSICNARRRH
jgi:hypothetical protein